MGGYWGVFSGCAVRVIRFSYVVFVYSGPLAFFSCLIAES